MKILVALLLLAVPAAANAGSRQNSKILLSEDPEERSFQETWGYADAVIVGDTVYLSGVVASLKQGETDLQLPYQRAFQKIGEILARSGSSWDDVVDITSFHTDLTTQMPAIVAVKNKYVRNPPPAWTAIGVSRLIPDSGITEIKITAKLSRPAR